MITKEEIKDKILELQREVADTIESGVKNNSVKDYQKQIERIRSKANKRVEFYNRCMLYIETLPSDEFIDKQINQVKKSISAIDREFEYHLGLCKNEDAFIRNKASFYKDRGIHKLNEQLEYLTFISNK